MDMQASPPAEHVDILIIGAGLSGIGAGCHLSMRHPKKSFLLLEGRGAIGGTWDLFRYPGIRSDSDMYTLGYSFRPWREAKAIADGPSILKYVRDTAAEYGVDGKIRLNHKVRRAAWSSEDAIWTVEAEVGEAREIRRFTCRFLLGCSGYYDYAGGYMPDFPGVERFAGQLIHPQTWPEDLDYAGKRVVVIGSGATAVTLVPAMAATAAHVTMLQRSPTYVVSRPAEDAFANWLRRKLPGKLAYGITRWRNVLLTMFFYNMARKQPDKFKAGVLKAVRAQLGPDYDVQTHFTPRYKPWDQRLCLVPDADLFRSLREGRASVVTDRIATFTERGVELESGAELEADIVVAATGLKLILLSGIEFTVDGERRDLAQSMSYKGMMFSGVPNLAAVFGYTNASWTLKADLTCEYVCRILGHMDRRGLDACTPVRDAAVKELPFVDFSSGYIQRALDQMPKQGETKPWRLYQNYALDMVTLRYGRVDDGTLRFERRGAIEKFSSPGLNTLDQHAA